MAEKKTTKKTATQAAEVLTIEQLTAQLAEKSADLLEARKSNHSGELANPRAITHIRKEIARLNTAIRALEIAAVKESK